MNAPSRHESFVLEDGEPAVEVLDDTKLPNAATVKIYKQDHTLANMIRAELLTIPTVIFAGYKVPHPLESMVMIKLQTDGSQTPIQAMETACQNLIAMIHKLQENFKREFSARELDMGDTEDAYGVVGGLGAGPSTGSGWGSGRDYMDF